MNCKIFRVLFGSVFALAVAARATDASLHESFEGFTPGASVLGTGGWSGGALSLAAVVTTSPYAPASGGYLMSAASHTNVLTLAGTITNARPALVVGSATRETRFALAVRAVRFVEEPALEKDKLGAFFLNADGIPHALAANVSGTPSWQSLTNTALPSTDQAVPLDTWAQFDLRFDFSNLTQTYIRFSMNGAVLRPLATALRYSKTESGFVQSVNGEWFRGTRTPSAEEAGIQVISTSGDGLLDDVIVEPTADRTVLNAALTGAQTSIDEAREGTLPGQYPPGAKALLQAAIDAAAAHASGPQAEVDAAAAALNAALAAFNASRIKVEVTEASALQMADGYLAGRELVVECMFQYPVGRQLLSLLWAPKLPNGWTLKPNGVMGDGQPVLDSEGNVIFTALAQLPDPIFFSYTVIVPSGETGEKTVNATVEYQLDGMPNPDIVSPPPLVLADAEATHAVAPGTLPGYLAGQLLTITNTFNHPAGLQLQSLLWRPLLPTADWKIQSVSGDGLPTLDPDGAAIVFTGDISARPFTFCYTVLVPPGTVGIQRIDGIAEYMLEGLANQVEVHAEPEPLLVPPLHTLQIGSAYGTGQPPVGIYTNFYGTALTNRMSASATVGSHTYACAGWLLSGNDPATSTGTESQFTITNNAALIWVWVAPTVGDRTVREMEQLSFSAQVAYTDAGFAPLPLSYSLDAASLAKGMTITSDGAFAWTPTEEQGGTSYSVTVTVNDSGAEPHGLTASETFTITVAEVNRAPTLAPLSDRLADEQSTLTFTATASDPDRPDQKLTFTLDQASLDLGMRIDPVSGAFTWAPSAGQAGNAGQSYTVQVTVTDDGENANHLADTKSFTIGVADSRATHQTAGYLAGRTAEIVCTFTCPAARPLESLLWRPVLPSGWSLLSVTGDGEPVLDLVDGTLYLTAKTLPNPVTFHYWVSVPAGVTGPQSLSAFADYTVKDMANPVTINVNPVPLIIPELHTYEVVSVQGSCTPAVGVYTNLHGTAVQNNVSAPLTIGTRTYACTGWTLSGMDPATGAGSQVALVLTNDAVLTWNWVAPLIAPANSIDVTMDEDGAPTAWLQLGITASEPYRSSLEAGLTWSRLSGPAQGTASVTGIGTVPSVTYVPAANWYGNDSFMAQVADGLGGFDHVAVNVTVNPVNDAPVLALIGDKRTDERTTLTFTATATDVDMLTQTQTLTYSLDAASRSAGMAIDPLTGVFTWKPTAGQAGADQKVFTVTVTVTDNNGTWPANQSDSETFKVTLDSSRATHAAIGYIAGSTLTIDCSFTYPDAGRQLQSLLWTPELPAGWTLLSAAGDGDPIVDLTDGTLYLNAQTLPNPVTFRYTVSVPPGVTGPQPVGARVDYQLNDTDNPSSVRAQPDPIMVPMLLTLPHLDVADKVYDGTTNATVVTYGALAGLVSGHDVTLVTTAAQSFFDTPLAGTNKTVTVSGLMLTGANASWYAIAAQTTTAAIAQAPLTIGGSFTVSNKEYDGTPAALIATSALTLATPVNGDDVGLMAVAVFSDKNIGANKKVSLSAASVLTGAAAGNYTLSLAGAPTAAGDILMPAVSGMQACDGFRSPSAGTVISNSFICPAGRTLTSLVWRPVLPAGWTLVGAAGSGASVNGGTEITFSGPFAQGPVMFTYTVAIPGNQAVTNWLNANVEYRLDTMADTLTVEKLPPPLKMRRCHSADYQAPFWVIDGYEASRFLGYWRGGAYHIDEAQLDGFEAYSGNMSGGNHSADYQEPFWSIDGYEASRVLGYWRAGFYHVDPAQVDGYEAGP